MWTFFLWTFVILFAFAMGAIIGFLAARGDQEEIARLRTHQKIMFQQLKELQKQGQALESQIVEEWMGDGVECMGSENECEYDDFDDDFDDDEGEEWKTGGPPRFSLN